MKKWIPLILAAVFCLTPMLSEAAPAKAGRHARVSATHRQTKLAKKKQLKRKLKAKLKVQLKQRLAHRHAKASHRAV